MRIKDVIHGEIVIENQLIIDLIQTKEFQRLRKIKQLGLTNLIFPGAEHTRFSHSIGVYYITEKILKKFEKNNKIFYTEEEKISIITAALLHDLGHGPLSHAAETFFNYSHEDYTIKIIENPHGEINKILKKYEENTGMEIINNIMKFINKKHSNYALNSIISSSVDADRMDYLVRDSYYTGAVYGTIDVDRLIDIMDYADGQIIFSEKGIHTLEDFILSRYHMFVQVYLNKKTLGYEMLVQQILNRVFLLYSQGYKFKTDITLLLDLTEAEIQIDNYLKINDYNFLSVIGNLADEKDEILVKMVNVFEKQLQFKIETTEEDNETENKIIEITDSKMIFTTNRYVKKVYETKEAIWVKKENTNEIVKIESISPIFKLAKNKLEIMIEKMYFTIDW